MVHELKTSESTETLLFCSVFQVVTFPKSAQDINLRISQSRSSCTHQNVRNLSVLNGHFLGGRGILGYSKLKVPSSDQIFIFRGRGDSGHHIPQILEWGHSRNFAPKILPACTSCIADSLSHTTRVETNKLCDKYKYKPERQCRTLNVCWPFTNKNNEDFITKQINSSLMNCSSHIFFYRGRNAKAL